jgi:cytidine deaminase
MDPLIEAAIDARNRAHAPYSKFAIGCALEDEHGRIFSGCNIESASFGLTICAERVALFKAVSEASGRIKRIAVVSDTASPAPPCGACRQILCEFCRDAQLILANLSGRTETIKLAAMLPRPFDSSFFRA